MDDDNVVVVVCGRSVWLPDCVKVVVKVCGRSIWRNMGEKVVVGVGMWGERRLTGRTSKRRELFPCPSFVSHSHEQWLFSFSCDLNSLRKAKDD